MRARFTAEIKEVDIMYKMNPEMKKAWDEVLFWAKRCSYKQADNHPEWHEKYKEATNYDSVYILDIQDSIYKKYK